MIRTLGWTGNILLVLGGLIAVLGYIGLAISQGFADWWNTTSPFNISDIVNWIIVLILLAPGLGIKALAGKLRDRR